LYNVVYVALNTSRAPFDDVRARHAANQAVNKAAIAQFAYGGFAVPALGPVPPGMWSHAPDVVQYGFDPEAARRLLAQVPSARARRLRLLAYDVPRPYLPDPIAVGRTIQQSLQDVGFEVELVLRGFDQFMKGAQQGTHDLCLVGWIADVNDPDNFLYTLLDADNATKGSASNAAFYKNPEVHSLLLAAQRAVDRKAREQAYRRVQELVAGDAPWIPLVHADVLVLARRSVADAPADLNGIDFARVTITER
jgi:peptide/nickel transport system substrate-binding protein